MPQRRRKLDTSPIDYDDVASSPSLHGMVSFLAHPPGKLPRLDFSGTPGSGAPVKTIPPKGVPDSGIPVLLKPAPRIRRASTAAEGHSAGEHALYLALWAAAKPSGEHARTITAGYRTISALANLTVNNCKANLLSLMAKLAIEQTAVHSFTQGRSYVVFSEEEILRRRQRAGLLYYTKDRGVRFVDDETGVPV